MFLELGLRFFQGGFRLIDGSDHFIKRRRQAADLIDGFYFNPVIQVTGLFDMISSVVERFQWFDHKILKAQHCQCAEQHQCNKKRCQDFKNKYPDGFVDFSDGNNGGQLPLHQRRGIIKCIPFLPIPLKDRNAIDAGIKIFEQLGIC